jgi:hypothetical protein
VWIVDGCHLDARGVPTERYSGDWDDELGHRLPLPRYLAADCPCEEDHGCSKCRLRLQLPMRICNTTLDERHRYRLCLSFWTRDGRWVRQEAHSIQPDEDGDYPSFPASYKDNYSMPGPLPGQEFEITPVPDTNPGTGDHGHPFSWQPVAWYVDLYRDQLGSYSLHGLKVVLTCTDTCNIQEIRYLWFKMKEEVY